MRVALESLGQNYLLKIDYQVAAPLTESWDLIASNSGLVKWFPQLKLDLDHAPQILVFQAEDFREEMEILAYEKLNKISYQWDSAQVTFCFRETSNSCHIFFEEVIPKDFGNEWTDAQKDMRGWLVLNEKLEALLNQKIEPNLNASREKWQAYLAEEVNDKNRIE